MNMEMNMKINMEMKMNDWLTGDLFFSNIFAVCLRVETVLKVCFAEYLLLCFGESASYRTARKQSSQDDEMTSKLVRVKHFDFYLL